MINSTLALDLQLDADVVGIDGVSDMDAALYRLIELCTLAIGANEPGVLVLRASYTRGDDVIEFNPLDDDQEEEDDWIK